MHTLIQHIDSLAKRTPRPPVRTVHMARCMDIRSPLVNSGMDHESGRIDWFVRSVDAGAVFVDTNHVRDLEQSKVDAVWINPECMGLNGVWNRQRRWEFWPDGHGHTVYLSN